MTQANHGTELQMRGGDRKVGFPLSTPSCTLLASDLHPAKQLPHLNLTEESTYFSSQVPSTQYGLWTGQLESACRLPWSSCPPGM